MSRSVVVLSFALGLTLVSGGRVHAQATSCQPRLVGADRRGPAQAISRSGNTLYLGAGAAVVVVDTTDITAPVERGRVDLDELALDVAHWQTTAIALGEHGLAFIDAADPAHPATIGRFPFPTGWVVRRVTAREWRAYVPEANGLHVLDFTDPSTPTEIGSFPAASVRDVVLNGDLAYLLAGTAVLVLDISDPAAPVEINSVPVSEEANGYLSIAGNGGRLAAFGNWCQGHLCGSAAELYSLANPSSPSWRSRLDFYDDWYIEDVEFDGDTAFVSELVYDVSDLANPVYLGSLWPLMWGRDMARSPDSTHLFDADPRSGLQVVDFSDPANPSIAASLAMPGASRDGYLSGSTAVIADENGLRTFDLSIPTAPRILGSISLPDSYLQDAVGVGDYAYLTSSYPSYALRIFDLRDPGSPQEVGSLPWYTDRPQTDDRLLVIRRNCDEALSLFDVSVPADPLPLGELVISTDCWEMDFALGGHRLYWWELDGSYPDYQQHLHVYDVGDPSIPVELANATVPRHRGSSAVRGRYLLLAESDHLEVVDARDPAAPAVVGTLALPQLPNGRPRRILTYGALALITSTTDPYSGTTGAVHLVDVSTSTAPVEVGTIETPGNAGGVFAGPGLIVVADGDAGISVYESCVPFADGFESGDTSEWSAVQP
jgi:hypothetical protein